MLGSFGHSRFGKDNEYTIRTILDEQSEKPQERAVESKWKTQAVHRLGNKFFSSRKNEEKKKLMP